MRQRMREIIFEADTPAGKLFDVALILCIVTSVLVVILDSVASVNAHFGQQLLAAEWMFTLLFSIEYLLRIFCIGRPIKYMTSFFGVVDLLSILPTYLSLLLPGTQYLLTIRLLRVLRVFRILKLVPYVGESERLVQALRASGRKIAVFLFAVLIMVVIFGSLMYVVEGPARGFTSLPQGMWYSIVTLTTVGYGDLSPGTPLGKSLAAVLMILGYGIIAVPTGIVTVEMAQVANRPLNTQVCPECAAAGHANDATFCKFCGARL